MRVKTQRTPMSVLLHQGERVVRGWTSSFRRPTLMTRDQRDRGRVSLPSSRYRKTPPRSTLLIPDGKDGSRGQLPRPLSNTLFVQRLVSGSGSLHHVSKTDPFLRSVFFFLEVVETVSPVWNRHCLLHLQVRIPVTVLVTSRTTTRYFFH